MKISIGTKIKEGPWGGGNLFAINLSNYLKSKGHEVTNNLDDENIDIILITEPRKTSESSSFTHVDIMKYIQLVNKETLVVHRINECDERKNTNFVNQYLIEANEVADYTVFVSKWLMETYLSQGLNEKNNTVILGGANSNIFNPSGFKPWDRKSKLKIVTHHWGAHWNKGFEIYEKLDQMIGDSNYKDKIEFCYIGNLPNKFKFRNSQTIKPLSGEALSNEIKKNHLYLTASINEPSGNHHIEAAQCGLPILYINSGGTPEYCEGYGIEFNNSNFEEKLNEFILNYDSILSNLKDYPYNSEIMCEKYFNLFLEIFENRENIVENRSGFDRIGYFDQSIFLLSRKINKYLK